MPKRLSVDEKIARAERKAHEATLLKVQGYADRAKKMLAEHPDLAKDTVEFLEGAIHRKLHGMTKEATPSPAKSSDGDSWLPQYTKLEATPTRLLRQLLVSINPIVFSAGNLRAFCAKHQRELPRGPLAECIEFATGLSMSAILPAEHRDLQVMRGIVASEYKTAGCVAERLLLPPDWLKDGYYMIDDRRASGEGLFVQLRIDGDGSWRRVPKALAGKVHIADNFSKMRATLRESAGTEWYLLAMLFQAPGAPVCAPGDRGGPAAGGPTAAAMETGSGKDSDESTQVERAIPERQSAQLEPRSDPDSKAQACVDESGPTKQVSSAKAKHQGNDCDQPTPRRIRGPQRSNIKLPRRSSPLMKIILKRRRIGEPTQAPEEPRISATGGEEEPKNCAPPSLHKHPMYGMLLPPLDPDIAQLEKVFRPPPPQSQAGTT